MAIEAEMMNKFQQIYAMLEDDESKDIYLNRLNYLITGDFRYMKDIINKYVPRSETVQECMRLLPPEKSIVLYGAGNDAEVCLYYFEEDPRFIGFCDSDEEKQKYGLAGYKVFDPEYLLNSDDTIVISSNKFKDEIRESLIEKGVSKERIFCFLPQMYNYREGEYFEPDFMVFEEEEIFVDAGAYNLETTMRLQNHCKILKKVYAFEPAIENYNNCKKYRGGVKSIVELMPYGT